MSDNLTEEQQVEAIKQWWKENGMAVIAGLVIGTAALFGWRGWNDYQESNAAEASALYGEFQLSLNSNDKEKVEKLHQQFLVDYASTPYAKLVSLAMASKAVEEKDTKSAKENLQWVLDNSKQSQIKHTARVRMIALLINDKEYDDALSLLNVKEPGGYAGVYEELRGDALLAKGDAAAANTAYDKALQSDGLSSANREIITAKLADTTAAAITQSEMVK